MGDHNFMVQEHRLSTSPRLDGGAPEQVSSEMKEWKGGEGGGGDKSEGDEKLKDGKASQQSEQQERMKTTRFLVQNGQTFVKGRNKQRRRQIAQQTCRDNAMEITM